MSDPRMTDFDFSQAEALAEMLRIQEAVGRELGVPVAVPRPVPAMDLPAAIDAFVASATTGAVTERDFGMAEALLSRLPESERAEAKAEINRRIADDRRRTETQNIQPLTGPTTTGELQDRPSAAFDVSRVGIDPKSKFSIDDLAAALFRQLNK